MSNPSNRTDRLSRSAVLLVHGIGPFDQSAGEQSVKAFCDRAGLQQDSLLCVNWDRLVLEQIASASFAGVLGSLGKCVTTAIHRSFGAGTVSRHAIEWTHLFTGLAIPWLIVGLFLPLDRWRILFLAAWSATMAVSLVLALVDRVSVMGTAGRTIALPLTWSFIHLAVFPATRDAWRMFLPLACLLAVVGLPFDFVFWLTNRMPQGVISETAIDLLTGQWTLWPWLAATALWFGMFTLLGVATRALLQRPLRLLLDIFRYAGDSEMRNALQVYLHRSVCSQLSLPRTHLVFLTHSLGSVIVVDYLLRHAGFIKGRANGVTLVTCGSPLTRFFWKVLRVLPCHPKQMASWLKSVLDDFRWVNVYRSRDPIGTALALDSTAFSCDVRVDRRVPIYGFVWAHFGYWGDSTAADACRTGLSLGTPDSKREPQDSVRPSDLDSREFVVSDRMSGLRKYAGLSLWAAIFIGVATGVNQIDAEVTADRGETIASQNKSDAQLTCALRYEQRPVEPHWSCSVFFVADGKPVSQQIGDAPPPLRHLFPRSMTDAVVRTPVTFDVPVLWRRVSENDVRVAVVGETAGRMSRLSQLLVASIGTLGLFIVARRATRTFLDTLLGHYD